MPHKVRLYPYMITFLEKFFNHSFGTNEILWIQAQKREYVADLDFYSMQKRFTPAHQTLRNDRCI